jgi:hypothetical protein
MEWAIPGRRWHFLSGGLFAATTGKPSAGSVSRKGVARFILDAIESGKYINQFVGLNG